MIFEATEVHMDWSEHGSLSTFEIERAGKTERHTVRTPSMTLILADDDGNIASFTSTRDAFTAIAAALRETKCND